MGWKATRVTGDRWPCSVCRGGFRGTQSVTEAARRELGAEASSSVNWAFRVSNSMIWPVTESRRSKHDMRRANFLRKRLQRKHPSERPVPRERPPCFLWAEFAGRLRLQKKHAQLTFFCNLITDVHFFSSRPAYFAFGSGMNPCWSVSRWSASNVSVKPLVCR